MIDEMRGGFDHTPGGAGRADAAPFAGVGDDEVVTAVGAAGAGKTVGEEAAFEVTAEFALGQCRGMAATAIVVQRQPSGRWSCTTR